MAKFDLGDFAKTMQAVPDSGTTGPERIEYLPLAELHEDERNFYTVDKVEELAANIQSCGLMDPLRVRKSEDGYTIVSGHRRAAALRLLAARRTSRTSMVKPVGAPVSLALSLKLYWVLAMQTGRSP